MESLDESVGLNGPVEPTCLDGRWGLVIGAVGSWTYVEEDQQAQGPAPPLEGEPRQASQHGSLIHHN